MMNRGEGIIGRREVRKREIWDNGLLGKGKLQSSDNGNLEIFVYRKIRKRYNFLRKLHKFEIVSNMFALVQLTKIQHKFCVCYPYYLKRRSSGYIEPTDF